MLSRWRASAANVLSDLSIPTLAADGAPSEPAGNSSAVTLPDRLADGFGSALKAAGSQASFPSKNPEMDLAASAIALIAAWRSATIGATGVPDNAVPAAATNGIAAMTVVRLNGPSPFPQDCR